MAGNCQKFCLRGFKQEKLTQKTAVLAVMAYF